MKVYILSWAGDGSEFPSMPVAVYKTKAALLAGIEQDYPKFKENPDAHIWEHEDKYLSIDVLDLEG